MSHMPTVLQPPIVIEGPPGPTGPQGPQGPPGPGGGAADPAFVEAPQGTLWYSDAALAVTRLGPGTAGHPLVTGGTGAVPYYTDQHLGRLDGLLNIMDPVFTFPLGPAAKRADASSDWRAAFQAAVDFAWENGYGGIRVPEGDYGLTRSDASSGYTESTCIDLHGVFSDGGEIRDFTIAGDGPKSRLFRLNPDDRLDCSFLRIRNTAGRVVIRDLKIDGMYTSTHGTNLLTFSGNAVAGTTVTLGSQVYTWQNSLAVAGDVLVGGDAAASRNNLIAAINHAAGEGTLYGTGTVANADVTAAIGETGTSMRVTSIAFAPDGLAAVAVAETMASAAWIAGTSNMIDSQPEQNHLVHVGEGKGDSTAVRGVTIHNCWLTNCRGDAINIIGENGPRNFLRLTAVPSDGETVTLGPRTYTYRTALAGGGLPGEVLIGATTQACLDNLRLAVNHGSGEGTLYGTGTTIHPSATAFADTSTSLRFNDSIRAEAATETLAAGAWDANPFPDIQAVTDEVIISDCQIYDTHRTCIGVQRGCRKILIHGNVCRVGRRGALDFEPTGNAVTNSDLTGNSPSQFVIVGNVWEGGPVTIFGIGSEDRGDYNIFAHNIVTGSYVSCLNLGESLLSGNVIRGNDGDDLDSTALISLRRCQGIVVSGNRIERPLNDAAATGPVIEVWGNSPNASKRIQIVGNMVVQDTDTAIVRVAGDDILVHGNQIVFRGTSVGTIPGVKIEGASFDGNSIQVSSNQFLGDVGGGRLQACVSVAAASHAMSHISIFGNSGRAATYGAMFDKTSGSFTDIPYVGDNDWIDMTTGEVRLQAGNVPTVIRRGDRGGVAFFETITSGAPTHSSVVGSTTLNRSTGERWVCRGTTNWQQQTRTVMHRHTDPASQSYPGSATTVLITVTPPVGLQAVIPSRWTLPAAVGDVQPGLRFTFSDASTLTRQNATASPITETLEELELDKDGLVITKLELVGVNTAATQTQNLGEFTLDGSYIP